jgi:hypothetical protein
MESRDGATMLVGCFHAGVFTEEGTGPVPEDAANHTYTERLCNIEFKVKDTRDLIKKLKTSRAPGPDQITARILQELAWFIAPALTILFRKSMAEGVVPGEWKRANVTPIFKKGSKSDPGNYTSQARAQQADSLTVSQAT